jgi:hypothetical protein
MYETKHQLPLTLTCSNHNVPNLAYMEVELIPAGSLLVAFTSIAIDIEKKSRTEPFLLSRFLITRYV